MTGVRGVGDGRVWVEPTSLGRVSLQLNESGHGLADRCAEVVLTTDEAVDLATHLLASVRPTSRFAPETGGAKVPSSTPVATQPKMPQNWPPRPGELWRDTGGDTWAVMASGKLVPLANDIDDRPRLRSAEDANSTAGPLTRISAAWDEVPF